MPTTYVEHSFLHGSSNLEITPSFMPFPSIVLFSIAGFISSSLFIYHTIDCNKTQLLYTLFLAFHLF